MILNYTVCLKGSLPNTLWWWSWNQSAFCMSTLNGKMAQLIQ